MAVGEGLPSGSVTPGSVLYVNTPSRGREDDQYTPVYAGYP